MESTRRAAIIVDVDGTVRNCDHRQIAITSRPDYDHKKSWGPEEYRLFYHNMEKDTPILHICSMVKMYHKNGYMILFLTGTPDRFRAVTMDFIEQYCGLDHSVGHFKLHMRRDDDFRCDTKFKAEVYEKYIKHEYFAELVLEDRKRVVKMWRELGVPCLEVAEANF